MSVIKIYASNHIVQKCINSRSNLKGFEFIDDRNKADIRILPSRITEDGACFKQCERTIFELDYISGKTKKVTGKYKRFAFREGFCVDDGILPPVENFCFSRNDFCLDPKIINVPVGFNLPTHVFKKYGYWQDEELFTNIKYNKRVFWKGSLGSHKLRYDVFNFFKNKEYFDLQEFKHNVYKDGVEARIHDDYIKELINSDMGFVLRGDRPSTHSFFDLIQYGCVPIMINCLEVGWENILQDKQDFMLSFSIDEGLDYINKQIIKYLINKENILNMKRNCLNLFETFFKQQEEFAWGEFLIAKCIEIYKNDFKTDGIDNKIICSEIFNIKNLGDNFDYAKFKTNK